MNTYDFIVVGCGIAGLQTALLAAEHGRVILLTKSSVTDSNTFYAQGGIAVASGLDDNPDLHLEDTIAAGDGLCIESVVSLVVEEGPAAVSHLIEAGVKFDEANGQLLRGMEGGHSVPRVLHANGAETGVEIQSKLIRAVYTANIELVEQAMMIDLLMENGRCCGVLVSQEEDCSIREIRANGVFLTTGGAGMLYERTTNPGVATADGVAAAIRAGAVVSGLEFFQFHPTALDLPGVPPLLISEALRGAGAKIVDCYGHQFLQEHDARAELAPRDVVARAIRWRLMDTGPSSVFLDATKLRDGLASTQYHGLASTMRTHGIDLDRDHIPVAPAAHYSIGGVEVDIWGRSSIPGLYACGEVAYSGLHGANRLASNSLLEAVVFAPRLVRAAVELEDKWPVAKRATVLECLPTPKSSILKREGVRKIMWDKVGMLRDRCRLEEAITTLSAGIGSLACLSRQKVEDANMTLVALFAAQAALGRPESRGTHYRMDFPERLSDLAHPSFYRSTSVAPLSLEPSHDH